MVLSGDFVAEYNRAMSEYIEEQRVLEEKFEKRIDQIVKVESDRLEQTFPIPFRSGDKVITGDGKIGKVLSCPVDLNVMMDEDYHGPRCGPNKFCNIKNDADEDVLTCEGLVRIVNVELEEVTQLEMDWGITSRTITYWPDDLSRIPD